MEVLTGGAFIGAGLVQAAITVALHLWGSTVASRRRSRAWYWASWLPLAALVLATIGVIGTVVQLVSAFEQVAQLAPELKASALSEAIGRAMRWTMAFTIPSSALYIGSIVAFTAGTLMPLPAAPPEPRTPPAAPAPPPA